MRFNLAKMLVLAGGLTALMASAQDAFKIAGKATSIADIYKQDQASFYDLEKKKYELVERIAKEKYLEHFWQAQAQETKKSVEEAKKSYEDKNLKISEKEVADTLDKFKDHPQLAKLDKKEQDKQIREYLVERQRRELYDGIIEAGIKKGDLVISYPMPEEPIYKVVVGSDDFVRFGPEVTDTNPIGCKGDDCPVTIVEYSEFQCPFCSRVMPDVKKVLTEYKGKVRWISRDFPLSFHDRARPAAIAAKCAGEQGKYWHMYTMLFDNQKALSDSDLRSYGEKIGVDKGKFEKCLANPAPMEAKIDRNFQSGVALGVSGTPAFFINGRRLSGAMPFSEFKRVIDEELAKGTKKS